MTKPLVIVTGASSGIGAAVARRMDSAGYRVLLLARRLEQMEDLELKHACCRSVDVTDEEAVAAAIAQAEANFGPVDLLVNNAGVMALDLVSSQTVDEFRQMFEVNCIALLQVARTVLPGMIQRRRGTIVNLGSIAGRNLYEFHTAYCGTKFAVHAMSEGLRREAAPHGVRVITVAPGMVATELLLMTRSQDIRDGYEAYRDSIGGGLDAHAVAEAVQFVYELPQMVCVRELVIAPTVQAV